MRRCSGIPIGTCSCWHGITSVVMGNCGFSLAPCAEKDKLLVMRNLERAEDIAPEAMEAGIKWSWETFPQYLDAVDRTPKGINYTAYMGHSALRTYVMGERAFEQRSDAEDLSAMKRETARGDSRRSDRLHHLAHAQSSDARRSSGREPSGELGRSAPVGRRDGRGERGRVRDRRRRYRPRSPERIQDYLDRLKALAVDTRRAGDLRDVQLAQRARLLASIFSSSPMRPRTRAARMFIQVHSRSLNVVLSFETTMPFDKLPVWRDIRKLPLAEQEAALRNPGNSRAS